MLLSAFIVVISKITVKEMICGVHHFLSRYESVRSSFVLLRFSGSVLYRLSCFGADLELCERQPKESLTLDGGSWNEIREPKGVYHSPCLDAP
jgi:hypothetical protein